jgi:serpin B
MHSVRHIILVSIALFLSTDSRALDLLLHTCLDCDIVAQANNTFAIDILQQLKSNPGNLFFSPKSISTALAMTYAGAQGKTATEMAKVLHFTLPPERLHSAMRTLLSELSTKHTEYQLYIANELWGQEGYTFLPEFLSLAKEKYGADLATVDFKNKTEAARLTINAWIAQQTKNKMSELIRPGILTDAIRLLLTNAIYFKADWKTQFSSEDTKYEVFYLSATRTIKVPLMHKTAILRYFNGGTFLALELPYKTNDLSMIILLPKAVEGLSALQESLTPSTLRTWLNSFRPASQTLVILPRFKVEFKCQLNSILENLGMKGAFDRESANFYGAVSKETRNDVGNLYISAIIHSGIIDVTEEGSEAAAITEMHMSRPMGFIPDPIPPLVFRADHPFLFLILDNKFGNILFMGRLLDPTQ